MVTPHQNRWKVPRLARGFTLVEILIVVSLIALLAAFAVPSYQRSRKRTQAVAVKTDLKLLDDALTQYAVENNKPNGTTVDFTALKPYIKTSSVLYMTGADLFGNAYGPMFTINTVLYPPPATYQALSDVADETFWSPFTTPP
jgi:prepilin-type N-terminal cleavage/methylation domain-containing protein